MKISEINSEQQAVQCEGGSCRLRALFYSFLKIGLFTFGGGYAMIPLIRREVVERRKWVAEDHFLELLTLAQSAPGPISLNAAVFVGYTARGWRGALAAISGVVLPSFVIILAVAMFFTQIRHNRGVEAAFRGMRPAVVALILAPVWSLAKGLGFWRIVLAAVAAGTVWWFGVTPIWFILAGAIGGIAWTYFKTVRKEVKR